MGKQVCNHTEQRIDRRGHSYCFSCRQASGQKGLKQFCVRGHKLAETRFIDALGRSCCIECRRFHARESMRRHTKEGRVYRLRARYGLTVDAYDKLLDKQEQCCAICKTTDFWTNKEGSPLVDHDHFTGAVRGILCNSCNKGLGNFHDEPKLLQAAINYLQGKD